MTNRRYVLVGLVALAIGLPAAPSFAKGRPPAAMFSMTSASVREGFGPLVLDITRTGNLKKAASVVVTIGESVPVSATAGADFTANTFGINFARNQSVASLDVGLLDDTTVEPEETYSVFMSDPSAGTVGGPGIVTILDDDLAASFAVAPNDTIVVPDIVLDACHDISAVLVDAAGDVLLTVPGNGGCPGFVQSNQQWKNETAATVVVRVGLVDPACGDGYTYYSDGTGTANSDGTPVSADHASAWVSGTGVTEVRIMDSGDCFLSALSDRQPSLDFPYNVRVGVSVVSGL